MEEIEALSQAYEEAQSKNDELRATLALKDEALTKVKSEKLRADHMVTVLKSEHGKLAVRALSGRLLK